MRYNNKDIEASNNSNDKQEFSSSNSNSNSANRDDGNSNSNNNNKNNNDDDIDVDVDVETVIAKPSWWLSCENTIEDENLLSPAREERFLKMQEELARFVQGPALLKSLRSDTEQLQQNLKWALHTDDLARIVALKEAIKESEDRDAELVYSRALGKIARAGKYPVRKKYRLLSKYTKEALAARQYIPRLNLDGLWIGKEGSELVNVTYTGDTLIAYSATGTALNRGRIIMKVDLSPVKPPTTSTSGTTSKKDQQKNLAPIQLQGQAANKWGAQQLERYAGEGHDPKARSSNDEGFVDANLIMSDGYFSFLWIPTRKHVFFSRPKPELIMHMMRDSISIDDELENMKDHLTRCYDKGIEAAFVRPSTSEMQSSAEPFRRIATESDLEAAKEETKVATREFAIPGLLGKDKDGDTAASAQAFWGFHKWMNYIDKTLKSKEGGDQDR